MAGQRANQQTGDVPTHSLGLPADRGARTGVLAEPSCEGVFAASVASDASVAAIMAELERLAQSLFVGQPASHTLQPAALVNEMYVHLRQAEASGTVIPWHDREHLLAYAATTMRRVLVDHARAKACDKRGGQCERITLDSSAIGELGQRIDLIDLNDAIRELEGLKPRWARVVEMRFFGSMNNEGAARVLEVSVSTVESDWRKASAWLAVRLTSYRCEAGAR